MWAKRSIVEVGNLITPRRANSISVLKSLFVPGDHSVIIERFWSFISVHERAVDPQSLPSYR